jgi:DNA-binding MarR family transcriptional regulator
MQKTGVDAVHLHAWRSFLTAHAGLLDRLGEEMVAETGLTLPWYEVLLLIYESDDRQLRMHELADSRLLSRSAMTRFVDRMEAAGLVHREACDDDRRGTFVTATEFGKQRFREAGRVHLRGIEDHFARYLTDGEAATLATTMDRVVDGLDGQS